MLGLDDTEERLRFGKKGRRLRRKGWTYAAISARLLGDERYARGVKKLCGAGYVAFLEQLQSESA